MRSDWDEMQATWNRRAKGLAWQAAGASAVGLDRSLDEIAHVGHQPGFVDTLELDPSSLADFALWRAGDDLSFLLVPSAGAVSVIASGESAVEGCVPGGYPPPRLEVDFCP
jgi:hypothetical protein